MNLQKTLSHIIGLVTKFKSNRRVENPNLQIYTRNVDFLLKFSDCELKVSDPRKYEHLDMLIKLSHHVCTNYYYSSSSSAGSVHHFISNNAITMTPIYLVKVKYDNDMYSRVSAALSYHFHPLIRNHNEYVTSDMPSRGIVVDQQRHCDEPLAFRSRGHKETGVCSKVYV